MNIYLILWLATMCLWLVSYVGMRAHYEKEIQYFRDLSLDYFDRWMKTRPYDEEDL